MNVRPLKQNNSQSKPNQQNNADNFVKMGEWIPAIAINAYIRKHLENNPEKIRFGLSDNDVLSIMIDK